VVTAEIPAGHGVQPSFFRSMMGGLQSVLLLLLIVLLFPLAILVIGTPIAFCVRVALELASRL
jgi:hypothetical protein